MFAQSGHWRPAFWVLVPVALLLALIVASQFRGKAAADAPPGRVPWLTIALLVLSVLAISAASLSQRLLWNAAGIAAGVAIAALIVRIDRHARARLLPSGAYSLRAPLGVLYAVMSLLVAALTTEIFVPYFLQVVHQQTPLAAGYMLSLIHI